MYIHTTSQTEYYGAVLTWSTDPILQWQLVLRDGTILNFPPSDFSTNPNCQGVSRITDRYGNFIKLDRAPSNCNLTKITSPNGRTISLSYDSQGRNTQAVDNIGRTVQYAYDTAGRLATVTDVAGGVTTYAYDDQNRMTTITDARGILYLTNVYDSAGRVIQQTEADGGSWLFNWTDTGTANATQIRSFGGTTTTDGGSVAFYNSGCYGTGGFGRSNTSCAGGYMPQIAQVDVTDPRGYVERMVFGTFGYPVSDTHALGQPEQQTVTYTYYSDNLLKSVTDPLGRVSSFDYDSQGHTVRVTNLDGTAGAVTSTFSYNGPFGQLTSATDPLGHTSTFSYDV